MLERHIKAVQFQVALAMNRLNRAIDSHVYILNGYLPGTAKLIEKTLPELQAVIAKNVTIYSDAEYKLDTLLDRDVVAALDGFSINHPTAKSNTGALRADISTMDIECPKAKSVSELSDIASMLVSDTPQMKPVEYDKTTLLLNASNELLDSCSYILRGTNPRDGSVISISWEDTIAWVRRLLEVFRNNAGEVGGVADYADMAGIATLVESMLNTSQPFTDIAWVIDENVAKLPLLRRPWA